MKKYDSYSHNSRSSFRPSARLAQQDISSKNVAQSSQNNFQKPEESRGETINLSSAVKINSLTDFKPQVSIPTGNKKTNSQNAQSQSIALNAIKTSKPGANQRFSDDYFTIYGEKKRRLSIFQKSLYGLGVLVIVFSGFVSVQTFLTNKYAKQQVATLGVSTDDQGVSEGTGSDPSEEPISDSALAAYQVSNPEDPRYLRIPELKVFTRIKNLGTTTDGAVDAPRNIYDSGWYNGSARPGSSIGSSLILGHVSGWTGPGVFKNINKLSEGSRFEIEKGNGDKVYYEVSKTEQIPADLVDMSQILSTEVSGVHDLKLMTCGGKYNRETKEFEERVVVYAKQLK